MKINLIRPYVIVVVLGIGLALASCHAPSGQNTGSSDADSSQTSMTSNTPLSASDSGSLDKIHGKLMAIHEDAMDKIGPLRQLTLNLNQDWSKQKDTAVKAHEARLAKTLHQADSSMFAWMEQYKSDMKGMSDSAKLNYQKAQLVIVSRIHAAMDSAMAEAKSVLH